YLTTLGAWWTSAVSVADLLQTDDLFQRGQPRAVPALPDLNALPTWPCCHECLPDGMRNGECGVRNQENVMRNADCVMRSQGNISPSAPRTPNAIARVAGPGQNVKDEKTPTTPFEDSGRATQIGLGHG